MIQRARFLAAILVVSLLAGGAVGPAVASPTIEEVDPNPTTEDDRGEYVRIALSDETDLAGWTLTDGYHDVVLPETEGNVIAVTDAPREAALLTEAPVAAWDGHLPLAREGERLALRNPDGEVVDRVTYGRTSEGTVWTREDGALHNRIRGPSLEVHSRQELEATGFVLPDTPEVVVDELGGARDRLWIGGYELTDPILVDILRERYARGVDVRVLIDGAPVSGQMDTEIAALARLREAGIPIRVLTGAHRRFQYHHPKYAIADDTAIVLSENWKPAGTGGAASRGWGVAIADAAVAGDLADIFLADARWRDAKPWRPPDALPATLNETPPLDVAAHGATTVSVDRASIVTSPEDAEPRLLALIGSAEDRIDLQQVRIGDPDFPLLEAVLDAARRGVRVRIQLDHSWYVEDGNAALVAHLEELSRERGYDLQVAMATPSERFEKIHNKGLIVDEETVVVGSMNWNNASMRENREVIAVLESEALASYYTSVFEADWQAGTVVTPIGFVAFTVCLWLGAGAIARRRIEFTVD